MTVDTWTLHVSRVDAGTLDVSTSLLQHSVLPEATVPSSTLVEAAARGI